MVFLHFHLLLNYNLITVLIIDWFCISSYVDIAIKFPHPFHDNICTLYFFRNSRLQIKHSTLSFLTIRKAQRPKIKHYQFQQAKKRKHTESFKKT